MNIVLYCVCNFERKHTFENRDNDVSWILTFLIHVCLGVLKEWYNNFYRLLIEIWKQMFIEIYTEKSHSFWNFCSFKQCSWATIFPRTKWLISEAEGQVTVSHLMFTPCPHEQRDSILKHLVIKKIH